MAVTAVDTRHVDTRHRETTVPILGGDVEITEILYNVVRKLDTHMRGAIMPSDVLQATAERIETERSIECLFEQDYELFLHALIDEILASLVPEIKNVLDLDSVWYDDYEDIQAKVIHLTEVCTSFRVFYRERSGLRGKVSDRKMIYSRSHPAAMGTRRGPARPGPRRMAPGRTPAPAGRKSRHLQGLKLGQGIGRNRHAVLGLDPGVLKM